MQFARKTFSIFSSAGLLFQGAAPVTAQQTGQAESRIQVTSELVLVNVVAHDKNGNLVRDLKKGDFTLFEDGKKQEISTFDFENVDELATAGAAEATVSGVAGGTVLRSGKQAAPSLDARDRRMILLFFDFSAMEPEQIDRSVEAAKKFVNTKMQPADLMALVSLATNMRVDLDFTDEKTKLLAALTAYNSGQGQGFENGDTGSAEGAAETSGAFSADDTDFNTFSADRKLLALQSLMQAMGKLPQKKNLIYFSNGITQTGADNQSALRAATAAAVKANVSIYSMDIRGLQAFPPGGEAQSASLHGQSAYSGAAVLNDLNGNAASQETLATLSSDTGGKAFFDSNDFGAVFSQVQKDSSAYYVLGFTSNNPLKDGRFRRLKVHVNRPDLKLDFRSGYYTGRDFEHLNRTDREQQLEDELGAQLPRVDVPLYAGTAFFRKDDSHYYLAVSLVVPGSQIPFVTEKEKDNRYYRGGSRRREIPGRAVARHGKAGGGQHAGSSPQERAVQHGLRARPGQLPPKICHPRESDGTHGLLRDGRADPRPPQDTAKNELGGAEQPACSGHRQEDRGEPTCTGPDGVGAEHYTRFRAGPASLFAI